MTKTTILQRIGLLALLVLSNAALAFQSSGDLPASRPIAVTGSMEVAFTPGQDAAGLIIDAIAKARRQILVQAYSFTHDGIARALIAAHHRGVEVRLIADREQTQQADHGQVPVMAAAGVPVWLDGEHQSAHNKIMVLDDDTVVTGSYNFTKAAQFRNAENVLVIHGNRTLAQQYQTNWQRHFLHAQPFTADKFRN